MDLIKKVRPGSVLVKISKDEKRKIFETDFTNAEGETVSFIKALEAGSETDEHFSQSVYIADVIMVGKDVKHIQPGDIVAIDYMADTEEKRECYFDGKDKVVILEAETIYHTDDMIAPASMNSRMDTYTWRKGDVDTQSWIYAIYRNGILVPNIGYILLEHKNLTWEGTTKSGLTYFETEGDIVVRKVIGATEDCRVKAGDTIAVETFALLERSIEGYNFDVIMSIDLLGTIHKN